jgi:hypothetical protein
MGNHFQLSSQELHLVPIKLGKRLYVWILYQVYFSLTSISQNVSRTQLFEEEYGALCPQINNSKLRILRKFSNGKLKAVKKL